ncbi:MAG: hypothetical protein AAFO94_21190 [Bacteroidota bacterium]
MKKDIPVHKVEDLAIAIVPREQKDEPEEVELWDTYLLNLKNEPIHSVLINSRGYGERNGEQLKTTVLRHFFEQVDGRQLVQIEPIQTHVFDLTNEYWVSFRYNGYMYDKKYIFVKGAIQEFNFTKVPLLNKRGVMIK